MVPFTAASSASQSSGADELPRCSAKGCLAAAAWVLRWRNPAIHGGNRTKQWLACGQHRDSLADFLARRGFLLGTDELPVRDEPGPLSS